MKKMTGLALAAALYAGCAGAGPIERACVQSERGSQNRSVCGCIQQVADFTLDRRDQRMAATFFQEPHRAQEVRQSDRGSDESFWTRYRAFGDAAESYCS